MPTTARPPGSAKVHNPWRGLGQGMPRTILLAAVDLFATRGYNATSTRDISSAVGLSPAALYAHFRSKEELLFEITRRGHDVALDMAGAAARDPRPAAQVMASFIYDFTFWHAENYKVAKVGQYELAGLDEEHAEVINHMRRRIAMIVRGLINRGVAEGSFDIADVHGATLALMSLAIDIARWFKPDGQYSPHHMGELYRDIGMRILSTRTV